MLINAAYILTCFVEFCYVLLKLFRYSVSKDTILMKIVSCILFIVTILIHDDNLVSVTKQC